MKGALRLAAHKVLDERPHFGGKYSEDVIERGIKLLEQLDRPPPSRLAKAGKKSLAAGWDDLEIGSPKAKSPESLARNIAKPPSAKAARTPDTRGRFGEEDLKELRKAIKANDSKRIAELTSKIGRPSFDD